MNDSVREELQDKISTNSNRLHIEFMEEIEQEPATTTTSISTQETENVFASSAKQSSAATPPAPASVDAERGGMTREFRGARRTSPILVEFQNKSAAMPEWRIQVQNAVRQRRDSAGGASAVSERPVLIATNPSTDGATALKTGAIQQQTPAVGTAVLENAVRRVEESKKRFSVHKGADRKPISPTPKGGARTFPIAVPKKTAVPAPSPEPLPESSFKEIVPELPPAAELDTDKLQAIPMPETAIQEVALDEATVSAEAVEAPAAEIIEETVELDEFADIELEIDEEEFELEEPVLETKPAKPALVRAKTAAPKLVTLPLFPDEEELVVTETVGVAGTAETFEPVEMVEVEELASETVAEESVAETRFEEAVVEDPTAEAFVEEIVEEYPALEIVEEIVDDCDEEIHETSQPELEDDEVVYEFGDEHAQIFVDDYEYEPAIEEAEVEAEEGVEDLAPISMRFNAGLLDLIIGAGASLLLLSPFIVSGGKWFTAPGLVAFVVTLAIVMFIYMTATIGLSGRTLGMKAFSLEMIDVEENEYPDFHQAALSSSLYLVSLALGGAGFVTAFFNSERRAVHDLLSGTVIVREY